MGIEVTLVDGTEPGAFAAARAARPHDAGARRDAVEPAPRAGRPRRARFACAGPITVVDSTFATPLGQQPLAHGVHLSLHSATKGIAGLNDATLGVIAGEQELIDAIWAYSVLHGSTPSPYDALNAIRGIRTLAVRTTHQAASALHIAEALAERAGGRRRALSRVSSRIRSSTWPSDRCATAAPCWRSSWPAARPAAEHFLDSVQLARVATSLGGPETLVCHPATSTHASLTPDEAAAMGVSAGLLRISVGLEDTADLVSDLTAATAPMTRVLCLHGLGGTGATMWPIVAACIDAGFTTLAPTLPGHGTDPADLVGVTWSEWLEAARAWEADVVVGQSMGADSGPATRRRAAMPRGGVHQPGGARPRRHRRPRVAQEPWPYVGRRRPLDRRRDRLRAAADRALIMAMNEGVAPIDLAAVDGRCSW